MFTEEKSLLASKDRRATNLSHAGGTAFLPSDFSKCRRLCPDLSPTLYDENISVSILMQGSA